MNVHQQFDEIFDKPEARPKDVTGRSLTGGRVLPSTSLHGHSLDGGRVLPSSPLHGHLLDGGRVLPSPTLNRKI